MSGRRFKPDFVLDPDEVTPYIAVDNKGRIILSPESSLISNEVIVYDGQVIDVDGGGTVTLSVVDNVITGVAYAP